MKWFAAVLVVLTLLLQYRVWLSDDGTRDVVRLRTSVEDQRSANAELARRNGQLAAEVADLKKGMSALEERARSELGMVASNESFFQVAGYFYFYGHYYAARALAEIPAEFRPHYQDNLARIIMKVQDADGSWWDYPLYNYHQPYGTAYALMTLHRCRRP